MQVFLKKKKIFFLWKTSSNCTSAPDTEEQQGQLQEILAVLCCSPLCRAATVPPLLQLPTASLPTLAPPRQQQAFGRWVAQESRADPKGLSCLIGDQEHPGWAKALSSTEANNQAWCWAAGTVLWAGALQRSMTSDDWLINLGQSYLCLQKVALASLGC